MPEEKTFLGTTSGKEATRSIVGSESGSVARSIEFGYRCLELYPDPYRHVTAAYQIRNTVYEFLPESSSDSELVPGTPSTPGLSPRIH